MKVVIQRVKEASVSVEDKLVSSIGAGLLVLLGIEVGDSDEDFDYILKKTLQLRIFDDDQGVMNLDVRQIEGEILLISQFTLLAATKKGNRPSYIQAARPEVSEPLYERMAEALSDGLGKPVQRGIFGADMQVSLVNDGPVTIVIDSRQR
ncbi:MAG: D-aminoacyl-tRNA deacylase [Porphyromonas sp.]|nr:D-aminoacyl-tRNA deacylase [Porphyromonas sp.]